jgi:hypothetical protein
MKTMRRDESGAIELLFIVIGIAVIAVIALLMWFFGLVWFAVAGLLFFFGGLILLQGTPLRGWLGVLVGSILLIIALVIGVVMA